MILNEGQPEAWRVHSQEDAAPTPLYAERPPAILRSIKKKGYDLMFPLDFSGTLCARDGIKTGPHSPNGEDAYDRKLVVMRKKRKSICFENHQTDSRISEIDVAATMGASNNAKASNNNPLIIYHRGRGLKFYYHHKCTADVREMQICPCMGAERNTNASNDNPLIIWKKK